jgi:hypothetical protein
MCAVLQQMTEYHDNDRHQEHQDRDAVDPVHQDKIDIAVRRVLFFTEKI